MGVGQCMCRGGDAPSACGWGSVCVGVGMPLCTHEGSASDHDYIVHTPFCIMWDKMVPYWSLLHEVVM